jgi:hypothetical protein
MTELEDQLTQLLHDRASRVRVVDDLDAIRGESDEDAAGSPPPESRLTLVRPEAARPAGRSAKSWGLVAASLVAVAGVGLTAVARLTSETDVGENRATPSANPAASAPADTLVVRCDGDSTTILAPTVRARTDGVHLRVENTGNGLAFVEWVGGGVMAPLGGSRHIVEIPPGAARIRCSDGDEGSTPDWGSFTVLEPPGWVSETELDCAVQVTGIIDYVPGAGDVVDPLADAIERAESMGASDDAEVVPVGYVSAARRTFVVLDGGKPTMAFEYLTDGQDAWLFSGSTACSD